MRKRQRKRGRRYKIKEAYTTADEKKGERVKAKKQACVNMLFIYMDIPVAHDPDSTPNQSGPRPHHRMPSE